MAVRSLNKAMIIGNLTRDPELRYTANGTAIVTFGVATNREYTLAEKKETVEAVEFHNVVAWAKLAELCNQLLSKGTKVYIEGRLQTRDWVDADSSKKMYRTEIVAEEMIILSSRTNDARQTETHEASATPAQNASSVPEQPAVVESSSEIPF